MVMPVIPLEKTLADGAATEGGHRPTVVAAPSAASPELPDRPRRRTFTAAYKLRVLRQIEVAGPGGIGAILRREGLYSSLLTDWRRQRDTGACEALKSVKRGPKVAEPNPLAAEHARLQRDNKSLTLRVQRAEAIIEIQKKWLCCWACRCPATRRPDGCGGGPTARRRVDRRGLRGARRVARQLPSSERESKAACRAAPCAPASRPGG